MHSLPPAVDAITGIYLPPGVVCLSSLPNSPQHPSIQGTHVLSCCYPSAPKIPRLSPIAALKTVTTYGTVMPWYSHFFYGKIANTMCRRYRGRVVGGKSQTRRYVAKIPQLPRQFTLYN
ncbi:unnamed protein product [Ectocarpus sp. 12 AP-2014]